MAIKTQNRESVIFEKIKNILIEVLDPEKIILFGSRAKNLNDEHADFDFAVDKIKPGTKVLRKVNEEIEKISGLYSVDLVFLKEVDKKFAEIITNTGRVVYEKGS